LFAECFLFSERFLNDYRQTFSLPSAAHGKPLLTVKFRQPSHEFTIGVGMTFILSIGTNPLGITSSFVHVGFGV
jgi:hypothetical protein